MLPPPVQRIRLHNVNLSWSIINGLKWPATPHPNRSHSASRPSTSRSVPQQESVDLIIEGLTVSHESYPTSDTHDKEGVVESRLLVQLRQIEIFDRVQGALVSLYLLLFTALP